MLEVLSFLKTSVVIGVMDFVIDRVASIYLGLIINISGSKYEA